MTIPLTADGATLSLSSQRTMVFSALKAVLKERKITYKDLADRTKMSESSIKRIFSTEECSLTRLTDMLAVADVTLADLMEYASHRRADVAYLSREAEEFFATSLDCFFVYRKLFHHRSVAEVRKREKLTSAQMSKYLKTLDALGVLEWLPGDDVRFPHPEFLKLRDDGPLKPALYRAWAPKLHQVATQKMGDGNHELKLFSARCTLQLRDDFLREFTDLADRFMQRAALEIKTQPSAVRPFAVSLATAPLRIGLDESDAP